MSARIPRRAWLGLSCGLALLLLPRFATGQEPSHFVDQKEVCLSCHDLEDAFTAPVQHAPVSAAECSACHNPHAARLGGLLHARSDRLCGECHQETLQALGRAEVHAPVAAGECAACHAPHASDHAGLLQDEPIALCAGCHADVDDWRSRSVQHSPFRKGQCERCHDPHASDLDALAVGGPAEMCGACHPASAKFRADHGGYPVERASCEQCHDPHASNEPGLLHENLHAAMETGECGLCHVPPESPNPFALAASQAELCGDCHDESVERSLHAPFRHVSAGGGRCTECHNPHAGAGEALLHGAQEAVCLSCHDPGGAGSGEAGRYVSHADLACETCHGSHGGDRPVLLVASAMDLCNECHGHQHNISHPMGEATRDPRNGRPMDCLSCHGVHYAPAEGYLHASGQGEICVGCHTEITY